MTLVGCGAAGAQENKPTVILEKPPEAPQARAVTSFKVPLLSRALRLQDFAGMEPGAEVKGQLARIAGFTQTSPVNEALPTEKTEVYIGRTRTTLQVGFVCHDARPALIRRHMARRENILTDDNVGIVLDTFADRRHGILFQVNPLGVQADAAFTEGSQEDYSYDQVWDSAATVTARGWVAVMSIPFTSLRFREGGLPWGFVAMRVLPRNSEEDEFPAINANIAGELSQEGTLTGIEGVTGSHNVQLNPYGLLQNEHDLNSLDLTNPYFSNRKLAGTVGGDAKVIVKDSVVLDATINPDFSQVESDQPQFTVNQRYPVYFPELRPFFLENANYFATPIDLVYTRNIVHPEFGGRATGKIGKTNLGILAITDRGPGEVGNTTDVGFGSKALFAVGRVSEDLGQNSNVGLLYTDEEFAGSWNRIGGIDFTARLGPQFTLSGQSVASSTKGLSSAGQAGSYAAGPASQLTLAQQSHRMDFQTTYRDYSQGFQSTVGFIQTTAFRQDDNSFHYKWFPKNSFVQEFGLEENGRFAFDRLGNRVYHANTFDPFVTLARNTVVAVLVGENSDTLSPLEYPALTRYRNYTENFAGLVLRSAPISQVNFNVVVTHGGNPNYNPVAGAQPNLFDEDYLQAFVTLQPIGSLTIDNTYLLDRNFDAHNGAFGFEAQTLRTKLNYQFTRAFSARAIVEYDSTLANPAEVSLVRTKEVQAQVLFTWLPHPGTAIYAGYNNDLQNLNHTLCSRVGGVCDPTQPVLANGDNYLNTGRQFFVKASYLLRF